MEIHCSTLPMVGRMVGAFGEVGIKSALSKSVGSRSLKKAELETTLHEVEACINSRPLTFVGDDIDSQVPLTPTHFLLGNRFGGVEDPGQCT